MNNINEMLKKAKRIQGELEKEEQLIAKKEFVIEKQGIKITMLGTRKVTKVEINPALIDPDDPELLQDLVLIAVNEAIETIDEEYDQINAKYAGGGLPF
ncbi:YbaB/EbfC family nucleoid-associated protein [Mycoplasma phocoeninasale]|uniref:Nucleoid-associated protein HGG64_02440 n=1 Tax=Mycoplasma phocoeninasale TaxID=2726117 RepID=A0A858U6Y2_9MOLU|nr:YbaB/EbfC family nucleoid-associated protein [Mycoplasma phocoeninasale]MBN0970886.1 YbaB/EbfC family nucleoid-associated protein [Mycoplasma phocoeninasale]QJG66548.1 YbaB/EbfC family nucleoid-associated protein [Mycoplasma phocoeninasale]